MPPSLPRSVAVQILLPDGAESLYGTKAEWLATLNHVLELLDACAHLVPGERANAADMTVTVDLSRSAPIEPDIQSAGAFLDFLAWSTIPLLALWIPDVNVQPELHVRVTRYLRSLEVEPLALETLPHDADPVATCYLDRRPFFSWPTLGAIFVPPFIFSGTDTDHVEAEIGAWVREATAVHVADIVRASGREQGELLEGLRIEAGALSGSVLAFTPRARLRQIVVTVNDEVVGQQDLKASEADAAQPAALKLPLSLSSLHSVPTHVSILAVGNLPGLALRYTLRVPQEAAASLPAPEDGKP